MPQQRQPHPNNSPSLQGNPIDTHTHHHIHDPACHRATGNIHHSPLETTTRKQAASIVNITAVHESGYCGMHRFHSSSANSVAGGNDL
mmetsp:Transcript_8842/g.24499  ORF Transcript_8842/g.24499 Transcript_8842/m.24499 type:complete len:88 (-) Transcript_8842:1270-1533(-)